MFPDGKNDKMLLQFNPYYNEAELLRSNGCLRLADEVPFDCQHPIRLSKEHPFSKLVIIDAHEKRGHGSGMEHLISELRSRFWIL